MSDFSELKRLAEAATPGPWECREAEESAAICHAHGWVADDFSEQTIIDTRYMAAANPAAILALIAENERLTGDLKDVEPSFDDVERLCKVLGYLGVSTPESGHEQAARWLSLVRYLIRTAETSKLLRQDAQAVAEYHQLKAENEALRLDAERYRWLREYTIRSLPVEGALESLDRQIDSRRGKEARS